MQGTTLKLRYDEALDAASAPAVGAYTLTAGSEPNRTPDTVAIDDRTVTLTFATAPADGAEVTLTYTVPASNPVKDAGGNAAPGFTGLTVVRGPVVRSIDPGDPPTTKPAVDDYRYTEAQLSSNVLGLRRWKLHKMTGLRQGGNAHVQGPVRPAGDSDGRAHPQARSVGRDAHSALCRRLAHGHAHIHLGAGVDRRQRLRRDRGEGARARRGDDQGH